MANLAKIKTGKNIFQIQNHDFLHYPVYPQCDACFCNLLKSRDFTLSIRLRKNNLRQVTELKLELKKRNLAVSGPKPTLVER